MAYMEMNALSTVLCGSFSAKVFLPEMNKLKIESKIEKYPVLWLFHSEGGTALDWVNTPAEECAADNGIFIIAADVQHSLCTDMEYGPKYEEFMSVELPGICRNNLPISEKPEENFIGGTGTGAYGAIKAAIKHPEVFSACIAMDGIYDMEKVIERANQGNKTGIYHDKESLQAVFGDLGKYKDSMHDVYSLAEKCTQGSFFMIDAQDSQYSKETERLALLLGEKAIYQKVSGRKPNFSCRETMKTAVSWLCGDQRGRKNG